MLYAIPARSRKIHTALTGHQIEDAIARMDVSRHPSRHCRECILFPQPAGMVEEMLHRDHIIRFTEFRQISANIVAKLNLPLADQQEHREGRELLGHRSDLEHAIRTQRHAVLQVRKAGPARIDDLVIKGDCD